MTEFNVDDLGTEDGSQFLTRGGQAWQSVCSWQPEAVGHRPLDWAVRDLIVGGAVRDPRNWAIRQLIKKQHPRLYQGTYGCTDKDRKQIARCRAYMFFHDLSLHRYREVDSLLVDRLMQCPPNLFLVGMNEGGLRGNRGLAKLCPYCLARNAAKMYRSIVDRVLAIAAIHGHEALVLGAWGCGVFGNDGREIAELFRAALDGPFAAMFSEVVFAVTDWSPQRRFIGPFEEVFGGSVSE